MVPQVTDQSSLSPSAELARRIVERLVKEHLLTADEAKKLLLRLSAGAARGEDWKLAIEMSEGTGKAK
jgi:hypothetical protein